nr:hypothetical protein [Tanacetum cinerariifolium]
MPGYNSIVRAFASLGHDLDFQNTSEPSNASTNVVNTPREPNVAKQDNRSFIDKIIFRAPDSPDQFHCFHCKDVLRAGEACKRCTCAKYGSGLGKGLCYICGHNHNSLNDSPSIFETSSQSPLNISHCCYECGDPLDGIFCKSYTLPILHPTFHSEAKSPFILDFTPTHVDESPNVFNPAPQPCVYPCEFCGNDAYYGHYCTPQIPFIYPESCYNQDFNFPQDFQDVPQQYPCCDDCGVTHDAYQCQPMTEVYYYGQNSCYDSTSIGFDKSQPQQYTVDHPIFNAHNSYHDSQIQLNNTLAKIKDQMTSITSLCELACQLPICYDDDDDDDEDYTSAITPDEPVLSTEEPDNSLMCDVPSHDNSPPLDVSKDQVEDLSESNKEFSLTDDDSFSIDDIDYIEASPLDSELVNSEVMEIVIPEVGGIDDDILLMINHDDLHEKLLNVNLLISKIEALNANPTPSSDCKTKSSSTSLNSLLEETNTFDNSLLEFETFCFDVEEISKYDCFRFTVEPNSRDFTKDVVENISPTKEPQVLTVLPTHPTLQLNMKFQPSSESLFAYVVWIFLPFLVYSVVPHYLLSLRNKDIIFDPGICKSTFTKPDISHRYATVKKLNTHRSHLNECPMLIHGQNNPLLDVLLFHFYPP